jgi:hypothetical protein
LTQIGEYAFSGCRSLRAIQLPRSIKELSQDWAMYSSLHRVAFESAMSLRKMIERGKLDLYDSFEITFVERDCPLDFLFRGRSLQRVSGDSDIFRFRMIDNFHGHK